MTAMAAAPSLIRPQSTNRKTDRIFFSAMALLILATVLFGFAKTYFLAGMVRAPLPNKLIHIHGAVFSLWIVLLFVQIAFISTHHVKWHMSLGVFGFFWAILMVCLGVLAAVDALRRGSAPLGLDAVTFFVIPMSGMFDFSVLTILAYRFRRNAEAHKRLIIIATIVLTNAAIGRWPVHILQAHPPLQDVVILAFMLLIVIYDRISLGRFSKATLWAMLFVVVTNAGRVPLGLSHPWHVLVSHLL
jgi:hypothetical protein